MYRLNCMLLRLLPKNVVYPIYYIENRVMEYISSTSNKITNIVFCKKMWGRLETVGKKVYSVRIWESLELPIHRKGSGEGRSWTHRNVVEGVYKSANRNTVVTMNNSSTGNLSNPSKTSSLWILNNSWLTNPWYDL